jgi:Tfp pilus assembly protein PilV
MQRFRKYNAGFSVVEVLLVLVVLTIAGAVGFTVYNNQHKAKPVSATTAAPKTTSTVTPPTPPKPPTPPEAFVNVIQDDDSVIQVTPDKIAKTTDQANILTAMHNTCTSNSTYVTVNHIVFDGNTSFIQDGTHAKINATSCSDIAKTLDDLGGSGSSNLLHKNSAGTWIVDSSSQMLPQCSKVDGLGYPASIVSTCDEDGTTQRAPK